MSDADTNTEFRCPLQACCDRLNEWGSTLDRNLEVARRAVAAARGIDLGAGAQELVDGTTLYYVNAGDTYEPTICYIRDGSCHWFVSCIGTEIERAEERAADEWFEELDQDELVQGCAAATLWASAHPMQAEENDIGGDEDGEADDLAGMIDDEGSVWTKDAREEIRQVIDWASANRQWLYWYAEQTSRNASQIGHDFALSRDGHGTGLWDRGAEESIARALHDATEPYSCQLFYERHTEGNGDVTLIDAL